MKILKTMKIIKNIILDLIIAFLIILVICAISSFVQTHFLNKSYFDICGFTLLKVKTGSMKPTLEIGDIIIVKLTKDIKEDDIITYTDGKQFITHRIIEITDDEIITKGDNNNSKDKPINKKNVVGKVFYTFNNVSVWKKVFSDIRVIIPVVTTIVLLFILAAYKEKIGEKND